MSSNTKWHVELYANGEQQTSVELTAAQIKRITKLINEMVG